MDDLKPCPFCGNRVLIKVEGREFQIVGCSVPSMLCPNPSMTIYKVDGEFDYTYWNKRFEKEIVK